MATLEQTSNLIPSSKSNLVSTHNDNTIQEPPEYRREPVTKRRGRSVRSDMDFFDDFENSCCVRVVTAIVCKIPCVIVCGIAGGDTYLLLGYSRLVLTDEIGYILTGLLLLIYIICLILLLTSYFKCMFTSCAVKDNPPPNGFDESKCPKCDKCNNWKPRRAHHCSLCGTCTLKMDHHCLVKYINIYFMRNCDIN